MNFADSWEDIEARRRAPEYDPEGGHVVLERYADGALRHTLEVRRGLEDAVVLEAAVTELRRRGYTVTSPEAVSPSDAEWQKGRSWGRNEVFDALARLREDEDCTCPICLRETVEQADAS